MSGEHRRKAVALAMIKDKIALEAERFIDGEKYGAIVATIKFEAGEARHITVEAKESFKIPPGER